MRQKGRHTHIIFPTYMCIEIYTSAHTHTIKECIYLCTKSPLNGIFSQDFWSAAVSYDFCFYLSKHCDSYQ